MDGQSPLGCEERRLEGGGGPVISTLTYQSKATWRPEPRELFKLLRQAKSRNRAADVTGMLVFKKDRFFQWLEGPTEAVDAIWASIQNDPRHKEIELLSRDTAWQRMFNQWDMRFACPDEAFLMVRDPPKPFAPLPVKLIEQATSLAVEQKTDVLQDGIEEVLQMGFDIESIYSGLVEPVAHQLGDLWAEDLCGDVEISVALNCLQIAVRRASAARATSHLDTSPRYALVIPPPGEAHMLGVALVGDLYREAGWLVEVEFPLSDEDVSKIVQAQWFDVMTVCISDVFTREHRVDALTATIQNARRASKNPNLVIVAGGRAFAERPDLTAIVGADATYSNVAYALENTKACLMDTAKPHLIN